MVQKIKPGKKTKKWEKARRELKKEYFERGIVTCELRIPGYCLVDNMLSFAHRYKRNDPRCEHTFKQTLLACIPCHTLIEESREYTEQFFNLLRNI